MTINLSSKGCSKGTGNATKDPRTLPLSILQTGTIKALYNNVYPDGWSEFWEYYNRIGASITYTTDDTWQTVIDLTNYHGTVYNLIGPRHSSSTGTGRHYFRITVDGTEYLIEPTAGQRYRRLVAGILLPFEPVTSDIDDLPNEVGSYNDSGIGDYPTIQIQPTSITNGYIPDPYTALMQGCPYLYFTESFKFEVKVNRFYSNLYMQKAGCMINYVPIL